MSIYGDVTARLMSLGYTVKDGDDAEISYSVGRASEEIKANINRTEIPRGLYYTHIDMAAGLFLKNKKALGKLGESFNFQAPAKSISQGDISVTFAGAADGSLSPEARFDSMVESLVSPPKNVFSAFRRMKW